MFSWAAISIPDTSGSPWFEDTSETSCGGLCCEGMQVAVSPAAPQGLAGCCHGWALTAGLLPPPGHQPGQQLHQPSHSSSKLHTAVLCPRATPTQLGLWLLIPANRSDLLWFLPVQKPSGAWRFSSHSAWVLEDCMLPFTPTNNFWD